MSRKKKIGFGMIGLVAILVVGMSIYAIKGSGEAEESVVQVERHTIPPREHVFVNGKIEPRNSESFGVDLSKGKVHKIHVADGQSIESGAPIVTYRREEVESQIKELQYQIDDAKAAKNSQPSDDSGLEAVADMAASTDYDSQIKRLESQIKDLKDKEYVTENASIGGRVYIEEIDSPEGVKTERITVQSGDYVVRGTVSEKDVLKLSEGLEAEITAVSNDKKLSGTLESISTRPSDGAGQIDTQGMGMSSGQSLSEYEVIIKLESIEGVKQGFHVQAKIVYGEDRTIIPAESLVKENGKQYVFLIEDNAAKRKEIQADAQEGQNSNMVVKKGLKQGDEIVVNPPEELKDGDIVGE